MVHRRLVLVVVLFVVGNVCWSGSKQSTISVSCTVLGNVALTYRALSGSLVSSPSSVFVGATDFLNVSFKAEAAQPNSYARITVRGFANYKTDAYRLAIRLTSGNAADEWYVDGVRLPLGQTVVLNTQYQYIRDYYHTVRCESHNAGGASEGTIYFELLSY